MVITGTRYAIIVHTDMLGYKSSVDVLDTPAAVGNINTDDYTRYGVYEWSPIQEEVVRVSGNIQILPSEIGTTGCALTVTLSLNDAKAQDILFAMIAPSGTPVDYLDYFDTEIVDNNRVLFSGGYQANWRPSFFIGIGGIPPEPPPIFWKDLVKAREIP
jgi:hypothetical protein